MNNVHANMVNAYTKASAADAIEWGFVLDGMCYTVKTSESFIARFTKLDKASRGAGMALRFRPNKAIKRELLAMGAVPVCSKVYFTELVAASKYNKGEIWEQLITERYGQVWAKDSVPFTVAGDITVNGEEIQVKFEGATFCNEKSLHKLGVWA